MSVVIHEVAHGFVADMEGDPTARYAGRLTLNPIKHIDLFGSIILPTLLVITHSTFLVGWAKPVPYSEANLRDKRRGTILVASAGIIANLLLAIFFSIVIRFSWIFGSFGGALVSISTIIVFVNLVLAFFNLIPISPLDGSKILYNLLPRKYLSHNTQAQLERYSLPILLAFIIFIWPSISPLIGYAFSFLTGISSF